MYKYVHTYIHAYIYIHIYIYKHTPALCLRGGRCADDESKVAAYVSIRQHTSAYNSIRHTYQGYAFEDADGADDESKVGRDAERKLERDLTRVAYVSIRTVAYAHQE